MEHKLVQGGDEYLPFARSRIKALRATGLKYASQSFETGSASIKVRIAGEHEYITLSGGVALWVFISTIKQLRVLSGYQPPVQTNRSWLYAVPPGFDPKIATLYHYGKTEEDRGATYSVFTPTGPSKGGAPCGALDIFESSWGPAPQKLQQRIATYKGLALTTERLFDGNTWRMRDGSGHTDTIAIDLTALSSGRKWANMREVDFSLVANYRQVIIGNGTKSRLSDVDRNWVNPIVPLSTFAVDAGLTTFTDPSTYLATYRPGHEAELWRYELMHQGAGSANIAGGVIFDIRTLPKLLDDPELAYVFSRDVGDITGPITNGPGSRIVFERPDDLHRFTVQVRVFVDGANKSLVTAQTPGLNPPFD